MTAHPHAKYPRVWARALWPAGLRSALNGGRHRRCLMLFMVVVLAHWVEHIVQAAQIWLLGWSRPESRGVLGAVFPWLVTTESLHYGYAVVMLIGIIVLRPGFDGRARTWWTVALVIQVWHHFEHALLFGQALTHHPLFGVDMPTSIIQLIAPRVELHLFYNALVFTPMVAAIYLQYLRPAPSPRRVATR
ncbi:MAG TPA: hypothetical protein VF526_10685 [Solirubrobacteraceae bacterium]|jgi:hypothetical protein